jgi:NitT/TauT family transport system permease protein
MAVTEHSMDVGDALDSLELPVPESSRRHRRVARVVLPKLAALAILLGIWQIIVSIHVRPDYVIPGPAQVWSSFVDQFHQGNVTEAVWTSVRRGGLGYVLSVLVGTPLGLVIARVQLVRLAIGSLISALQSLPSVVWVPFALVAFGPNDTTIFFVVIMGALPSIVNGMVHAVDQVPPLVLRAARTMGARGWRLWWYVLLPTARPGYIAGLRQGWSFSWRSLMAAELITRSSDLGLGLGQLLNTGQVELDMSLVIMTIVLILLVGIAVDGLIFNPLDRLVRERRGLTADA